MKRRVRKVRGAQGKKRLAEFTSLEHLNALRRALDDVKREVDGAHDAASEGACAEMSTSIDRAWYNLGKADAHYLALGKSAMDVDLDRIATAQRMIRNSGHKFKFACVRRKTPRE